MRKRFKITFALLLILPIAAVSARPALAQPPAKSAGQSTAAATEMPARAELALGYSYLHSNAPPGGCNCFNLNGGNATFAWAFKPGRFALVGDIVAAHANGVSAGGYGLTLSAFTAGVRYLPRVGHSPLRPFGQVLVGVAHSAGTLVQGSNPAAANAGAAFAANLGGGLDLRGNARFSLRLVEADYLVTTFDNGVNNHQNNLRLSSGVVLHF
jgi:peptidoglycan-associated lipoprotein